MFSPSQQAASELLLKRLEEGRGAVLVQGLSGSGKSHVAEKTLGGGPDTLIVDIGMIANRIDEQIDALLKELSPDEQSMHLCETDRLMLQGIESPKWAAPRLS